MRFRYSQDEYLRFISLGLTLIVLQVGVIIELVRASSYPAITLPVLVIVFAILVTWLNIVRYRQMRKRGYDALDIVVTDTDVKVQRIMERSAAANTPKEEPDVDPTLYHAFVVRTADCAIQWFADNPHATVDDTEDLARYLHKNIRFTEYGHTPWDKLSEAVKDIYRHLAGIALKEKAGSRTVNHD